MQSSYSVSAIYLNLKPFCGGDGGEMSESGFEGYLGKLDGNATCAND